jgi:hypothetical protein
LLVFCAGTLLFPHCYSIIFSACYSTSIHHICSRCLYYFSVSSYEQVPTILEAFISTLWKYILCHTTLFWRFWKECDWIYQAIVDGCECCTTPLFLTCLLCSVSRWEIPVMMEAFYTTVPRCSANGRLVFVHLQFSSMIWFWLLLHLRWYRW